MGLRANENARRRARYERKVARRIASIGSLESAAVRETAGIMRDLRRSIAARLGSATGFDLNNLMELQGLVEQSLNEFAGQYMGIFRRQGFKAFEAGAQVAIAPIEETLGITIGTAGVDAELFQVLSATTGDLITDVTARARRQINSQIQQAVTGAKRPAEALRDISKLLSTDKKRNRLGLKTRAGLAAEAERIVRTEMNRTFTVSQFEGMKKIGEQVPDVKKQWLTVLDGRERDDHRSLHEVEIGVDERFEYTTNRGRKARLRFPRDPGGPPEAVINCFLPGTVVQGRFVAGSKARYAGPARRIVTVGGQRLSVTPNHPVLTPKGFVPAKQLCKGDALFASSGNVKRCPSGNVDYQHGPAFIEDVFDAFAANGTVRAKVIGGLDFHGDSEFFNGEVDVVGKDGVLRRGKESRIGEYFGKFLFPFSDSLQGARHALCVAKQRFCASFEPQRSLPRSAALTFQDALVVSALSSLLPFEDFGFRAVANMNASAPQSASNRRAADTCFVGEGLDTGPAFVGFDPFHDELGPGGRVRLRLSTALTEPCDERRIGYFDVPGDSLDTFAAPITVDEVVEISDFDFDGHAYDLETETGLILSGGIVCSNCRCSVILTRPDWTAPIDPSGVLATMGS